jgi:hypothetical protein
MENRSLIKRQKAFQFPQIGACIYLDINKQLIFRVSPFDPSSFRYLQIPHITILSQTPRE